MGHKDEEKKINFLIGNLLSMVGLFTLHFSIQYAGILQSIAKCPAVGFDPNALKHS